MVLFLSVLSPTTCRISPRIWALDHYWCHSQPETSNKLPITELNKRRIYHVKYHTAGQVHRTRVLKKKTRESKHQNKWHKRKFFQSQVHLGKILTLLFILCSLYVIFKENFNRDWQVHPGENVKNETFLILTLSLSLMKYKTMFRRLKRKTNFNMTKEEWTLTSK